MQYHDAAIRRIMNEYDELRTIARAKRDELVEKVHNEIPEIKKIEADINRLGIENFGNIIKNPEKAQEINAEFEKNLALLNEKKAEILKNNNIPEDYDEVKYTCEKCFDTGYEDTKKCSCFTQKLINLRYDLSNMKEMLHDFSEFSFDYYSNKKVENLGITERENIEIIYKKAVEFCENEDAKNLFFYGGCGFGKTFLSSCIAKKMMDQGKTVIYTSASGIFSDYEDYKFGKKENDDFEITRDLMRNSNLLILDDLGCEMTTAFTTSVLYNLVNTRLNSGKKTIICSNLSLTDINKRYGSQLYSRLSGDYLTLVFYGEDVRSAKRRGI